MERQQGAGSPGDFWNAADHFFTQVIDESTREGALLDLSLTNKEELIRELKAAGNLGAASRNWWSLRYWPVCKTNSGITTLQERGLWLAQGFTWQEPTRHGLQRDPRTDG